jgi:hypothetical protein
MPYTSHPQATQSILPYVEAAADVCRVRIFGLPPCLCLSSRIDSVIVMFEIYFKSYLRSPLPLSRRSDILENHGVASNHFSPLLKIRSIVVSLLATHHQRRDYSLELRCLSLVLRS